MANTTKANGAISLAAETALDIVSMKTDQFMKDIGKKESQMVKDE